MRRVIAALVLSLAAVLLAPEVASADTRLVATSHQSLCGDQAASVRNPTTEPVNVKIYLDGVQVIPQTGWISRPAGSSSTMRWPAPAPGAPGVSQLVEQAADGSEVVLLTTTYLRPGFCDTVEVSITENCNEVRVQATNGWTSPLVLTISRTLFSNPTSLVMPESAFPVGATADEVFTAAADWEWVSVGVRTAVGGTLFPLARLVLTRTCDPAPPTATIVTPADGATYLLGSVVTADYSCADGGLGASGVASCVGTVADGAAVDMTSVGSQVFEVTATDNVGKTGTASSTYDVVYDWSGFFAPVDAEPVLNSTKAGSAVPVRFSLGGDQGLDVLADGAPRARTIACDSGTPTDEIEQTSTAGDSGLHYDAATQTYTYVWKTQKSWAKTCRQLVVELADGTTHTASFRFK